MPKRRRQPGSPGRWKEYAWVCGHCGNDGNLSHWTWCAGCCQPRPQAGRDRWYRWLWGHPSAVGPEATSWAGPDAGLPY
eukprot:4972468-Lingulodinium_polyedra.AAC.1